ncbi:MAG: TonB-dependent receptor [Alteraurantiacibacter sp.]
MTTCGWRATASHGVLALIGLSLAAPVQAQDGEGQGAASGDTIVVTGSLIRGSAEDAAAPVTVIGGEDLAAQGNPTIMDLSRSLAASNGVIGDASQFDPRSQFNQGVASVNLRGLGPQRTLVLLNGHRVVATGAGNLPVVDVNLIPAAALDRIEILKDGAAATYGSDAIGGVVNFITRTDQDGFLVGGDYRWIDGSNGDWTANASYGRDYGAVRVFLSGGYQRRAELRVTDRDFTWRPFSENPQGGFSGGGNPGNFDFNGSTGGTAFTADQGCAGLGGFRSVPGSSADLCNTSYLGFTNLVEPEERYQVLADVAVALGEGMELRLGGLYSHTATVLNTSPSFLPTIAPSTNAAFGGAGLFVIPAYAPALADYCARFGSAAGCALGGDGRPTQPALAFPVRFRPFLAGGNPLFDNDRHAAELDYRSSLYQLNANFSAELGSALRLDLGATYSRNDRYFEVGDSFVDLLQNALAGFGGATCAYASPQSRAGLTPQQLTAVAGTSGCTWFNPFSTGVSANSVSGEANPNFAGSGARLGLSTAPGAGLVNDLATIGNFYRVSARTADTSQTVFDAVVSGESGIVLPGGPVQFAVGAQARHDRYARTFGGGGNLVAFPCPGSVLNPAATCMPETGALGFIGAGRDFAVTDDVLAFFTEWQLPLTDRLSMQLSARYEAYSDGGPETFDPQARVRWQATEWLVLRGGVGHTFRGAPPNQTSADLVSLTFIGGAFRAVDLLANPDLAPEKATTWNAGAIVDHGGFHFSLDWWRYDFSGAIENEPVGGMVAAMFGASGTVNCGNPAYAGLQARFTFSGGVCSVSNVQRMATYAFNSADVTTTGLDLAAHQRWQMGAARLTLGTAASYIMTYKIADQVVEGIVVQSAFDAVGLLNYQTTAYPLPRWKGQAWLQAELGEHLLRLQANHIAGYEDQRGAAVFGPNNAALAGAVVPGGKRIGAFTTLDASWRWTLPSRTTLSVTLNNLLDAAAPFARLDQNFDPFTHSALGFTAKLGVSQQF